MNDEQTLRSYLLGALDEEQGNEIERRLLMDGDLFELAEAIEGDLLAAAARGELSPAERGYVLRRLTASPGGRARLALARGLTTLSREKVSPGEVLAFRILTRPGVRAAALAASLALMCGAAWLATRIVTPGGNAGTHIVGGAGADRIARSLPTPETPEPGGADRGEGARPAPGAAAPLPAISPEERVAQREEPSASPEPAPLVLQLALTGVRGGAGGETRRIDIPAETRRVDIRLPLAAGEPSTSFAAILRNVVTEEEIRREERITAREVDGGRAVVFSVPAAELTAGTYEVEVLGATPEGEELLGRPLFEIVER